MTPALRQAIELLPMAHQDVEAFVAGEVETNPLLDRPEAEPETHILSRVVVAGSGGSSAAPTVSGPSSGTEGTTEGPGPLTGLHSDEGPMYGEAFGSRGGGGFGDDDDDAFEALHRLTSPPTLREHLGDQIALDFPDPGERILAEALMDHLDEAGYLPTDLSALAAQGGVSLEVVDHVVERLQKLDPPGIFARSLEECLTLQVEDQGKLTAPMQILLSRLDLVARRERAALMKLCNVDAEGLSDLLATLRRLDPKPATRFTATAATPIVPDVFVYPQAGGWRLEVNPETVPRVLANESYYVDVRRAARSVEDRAYLGERWQRATWLVKALHQRLTTLVTVTAEVVRHQEAFFTQGIAGLRPLSLREVAETVAMHESTVSRVTQNKYLATPRGVIALRSLFTNALATTSMHAEDSVAAAAVRARIRGLIASERPEEVLSDDHLAALLRTEGMIVARRTVAKYREALRIPTSSQRRREKSTDARMMAPSRTAETL